MSRIGKQPIPVPSGVKVQVKKGGPGRLPQQCTVFVEGPKGKLERWLPDGITVAVDGGAVKVTRASDSKEHRAFHGLSRALVANMVKGVVDPFQRALEVHGTGYNAAVNGQELELTVGFASPVKMKIPAGLTVEIGKQKPPKIEVKGADKEKVGAFAAAVRKVRPPSPYGQDNKGIRYEGEQIRKKAGKAFGSEAKK